MSSLTLDAEALYLALLAGVRGIFRPGMRLVGVTSGGAWLAERLQRDLRLDGPPGIISSALHRDDFSRRGMTAAAQTRIPFDVKDANILLVDDVLYTGRTIRAAMNELFDYGRPASIRLAVLIDRGGRELPIAAVAVGGYIDPAPTDSFVLSQTQAGAFVLTIESKEH